MGEIHGGLTSLTIRKFAGGDDESAHGQERGRWTFLAGSGALTGHRYAQAAGWADSLFPERSRNFGPVPHHTRVKHAFILTNRLGEAVTILNLRPSCGCTSGKASVSMVNPGETAAIEAQMDARNFLGLKSTILYVTLVTASGREAEVRLGVSANILADIVLNPGSIDFGTVMKGQARSQVLTIDRIGGPGTVNKSAWCRPVGYSRLNWSSLVATPRAM